MQLGRRTCKVAGKEKRHNGATACQTAINRRLIFPPRLMQDKIGYFLS